MTKFESIGVNLQIEADSLYRANKLFRNSCNICCSRGIRIECDSCAIRCAHDQVVANFNDIREIERKEMEALLKAPRRFAALM